MKSNFTWQRKLIILFVFGFVLFVFFKPMSCYRAVVSKPWSQDPLHLKIIDDPRQFFSMWIIYFEIFLD